MFKKKFNAENLPITSNHPWLRIKKEPAFAEQELKIAVQIESNAENLQITLNHLCF